ncbi:Nn.00g059840.m01.CDS01 [Neocucurbitaria sp. VM-36]
MAFKALFLLTLAGDGLSLATKHLQIRDYRPKEHLILGDCGLSADGKTSTSRRMFYFEGDAWYGGGVGYNPPTSSAEVPWDGSYPWRPSGVSAKFENGDIFLVRISEPNGKDSGKTVGTASHIYDSHPFECYARHKTGLATLADGTKCSSAYICYHNDDPAPTPIVPAKPKPTFKYTAFNKVVELEGKWTADDIFKHAKVKGDSFCTEDVVELPGSSERKGQCKVAFKCGPNEASSMVSAMKTVVGNHKPFLETWTKTIKPNCEKKVRVCMSPISCIETCKKWGPSEKVVTNVTSKGYGDLVTNDKNWKSHIEFAIACPTEDTYDTCAVCKGVGRVLSSMVGIVSAPLGMFGNLLTEGVCGDDYCNY